MKKYFATLILVSSFLSSHSYADKVLEVYNCGADVGIRMQNGGWLAVRESEVGQVQQNRIYAMALMLLASGKPAGYYNPSPTVFANWCGITNQVRSITVLAALNE
jgi:hypothetical protein